MSKSEFGLYKYTVPQDYFISGSNSFINFIILIIFGFSSFVLFKFLVNITEFAYIILFASIVFGIVLIKAISNSNHKIFIGNRYVIIGEKIIYYNNLAGVQVSTDENSTYEMITKNNKRYKIEMNRFPTNASKSWKIEKNRKDKFEKITGKISTNISKCAPAVTIKKVF